MTTPANPGRAAQIRIGNQISESQNVNGILAANADVPDPAADSDSMEYISTEDVSTEDVSTD